MQKLTSENFDECFDELVEKGYIEFVRIKDGEAEYRLTEKALQSFKKNPSKQMYRFGLRDFF